MNETLVNKINIDQDLLDASLNDEPIVVGSLLEYNHSFMETLKAAKETIKLFEIEEIKPNFEKYDHNKNGQIDKDELEYCLNDLGIVLDQNELQ